MSNFRERRWPPSSTRVHWTAGHTMRPPNSDIVVLTAGGPLPWIVINAVAERFGAMTVIVETAEPLSLLFRRRLKRSGALTVGGQLLFGVLQRVLARRSATRRAEILNEYRLDDTAGAGCSLIPVPSVNSPECRAALVRLRPKAVLVVGSRMIGKETLAAIDAPFINSHAGINPKYRGMCGGYWALANGDADNFGATIHLVDHGVDTGGVLSWATAKPTPRDNFATYPYLLAATAGPLATRALEDALVGQLSEQARELPSQQWYHPTLWDYLWIGLRKGVW